MLQSKTTSIPRPHDLEAPARLPYLSGLDGFRAVAVMAVLFYHAEFSWAKGGFLGVEVFFVISGYLITSLLLIEWLRTDKINLKAFWIRRARRLLPAVFLLLGVVAGGSALFLRDSLDRLGGDILAASTYVTNWFFIFRGDSYFEAFGRPPLLQHLWSLSIEEQFYVLWPILFVLGMAIVGGTSKHATVRRFRWIAISGAIASTILMAGLFTPFDDPSRIYYGTDTRAAGILIGVALALWWMPWRFTSIVSSRYKAVLTGVGTGALLGLIVILALLNEFSPWLYRGGFAITSLLTATVIAVIAHPAGGFGLVLTNPVMAWIGTRSYGIYLWHWPIFMITRPGFDVGSDHVTTFLIRLALTFGVTGLSYRYVESPIRRLGLRTWLRGINTGLKVAFPRTVAGWAIALIAVFAVVSGMFASQTNSDPLGAVVASPSGSSVGIREMIETGSSYETTVPDDQESVGSPGLSIGSTTSTPEIGPADEPDGTATPVFEDPQGTPSANTSRVTLIGDSVLKGAQGAVLSVLGPDTVVDATVSSQFKDASDIIADLSSRGEIGDTVVIHLGTNGAFSSRTWDDVMTRLSDVDRVIVLTISVPRRWESVVNAAIASGTVRWPDVEVVDYFAFAEAHPEYFNRDGVHLNVAGQAAYGALLDAAING